METGAAQTSSLLDLLSYLLGVPQEEVSRLVAEFSSDGGADNPRNLFSFLAAQTRRYHVLWVVSPFTDQLSILAVAVMGPGREVVWWASTAVPHGRDSATFRLWHRVIEVASGKASLGSTNPAESEVVRAQEVARKYGVPWPGLAAGIVPELESAMAEKGSDQEDDDGYFEDSGMTRRFSAVIEQYLRESLGKVSPLTALRLSRVSLPDLRDLGLEVAALQQSLDKFLGFHLNADLSSKEGGAEALGGGGLGSLILPSAGVRELDPVVDPLGGVPLSSVVPGDMMSLQEIGGSPIPGRVYLIRVMRDGQFEIYGHLGGDKGFFKAVAPGDIKIALSPYDEEKDKPPLSERALLWGAVGLVGLMVVLLFYFLWG